MSIEEDTSSRPATGQAPAAGVERRQPRYAWVVMGLLWGMDLTVTLVFFSIGVLLPVWKEELGITPIQAGLLGSAGFLGFGIMALPASIWITRFNPRLVVLVTAAGLVALGLLQAVAPTVEVLLVGRFAFVLLAVTRVQMHMIFIQQWFQPRLYATANSIDFGNRSVGQMLGTAAVPIMVILLGGWREFYGVVAAGLAALCVVWVLAGRERHRSFHGGALPRQVGSPARVLWRHKMLWVLAASQIGAAAAFASFLTFFPTYMIEHMHISLANVGLVMGLFPIGAILGSLVSGPLSQRVGLRKPFIWAPGLLLPFLYFTMLHVDGVFLVMLLLFGAGVCAMVVPPVLTTIPMDLRLAPREVTVAVGLIRTLFPIGATIGPLLVGFVQESTGSLALGLGIVSPLAFSLFLGGILLPETGSRRR